MTNAVLETFRANLCAKAQERPGFRAHGIRLPGSPAVVFGLAAPAHSHGALIALIAAAEGEAGPFSRADLAVVPLIDDDSGILLCWPAIAADPALPVLDASAACASASHNDA